MNTVFTQKSPFRTVSKSEGGNTVSVTDTGWTSPQSCRKMGGWDSLLHLVGRASVRLQSIVGAREDVGGVKVLHSYSAVQL